MSIAEILRSAGLPVTVPELRQATGMTHEQVYQELVSLDGQGLARPVLHQCHGRSAVCSGWIYLN